jgi:hypothetical protein
VYMHTHTHTHGRLDYPKPALGFRVRVLGFRLTEYQGRGMRGSFSLGFRVHGFGFRD